MEDTSYGESINKKIPENDSKAQNYWEEAMLAK